MFELQNFLLIKYFLESVNLHMSAILFTKVDMFLIIIEVQGLENFLRFFSEFLGLNPKTSSQK